MRDLTTIPAFGWETAQCHANQSVEEGFLKIYNEKLPKFLSCPLFKLISEKTKEKIINKGRELFISANKDGHIYRNVAKVAGYLPVTGTIKGIATLIFAALTPKSKLPNKNSHIFRGAVEALGFGAVFLIPDAIVTIVRGDKKRPEVEIIA